MKFHFTLFVFLLLGFQQYSKGQSVTLSSPASASTNVDSLTVLYTISEPAGTPTSIAVVFTHVSGYNFAADTVKVWTLTMKSNSPAPGSFTVHPNNLGSSTNPFTASSTTPMPEGTYSIFCQYIRPSVGTTVKSSTRTSVYLDVATMPPFLGAPASGSIYSKNITLWDTIPEQYLSGSKSLTLVGPDSITLAMADNTLKDSININIDSIVTNSHIASTSAGMIHDGTYKVKLTYQDRFSHPAATAVNTNITIQTSTPAPSFVTAISNKKWNDATQWSYNIPCRPLSESVKLTASPGGYTFQLSNAYGTQYFPSSINNLASGNYTLTLSYQDFLGNPMDSVVATNVIMDFTTQAPSISLPVSSSAFNNTMKVVYTIPESYLNYTVKLIFDSAGTSKAMNTLYLNNVAVGTDSMVLHIENLLDTSIILSLNHNSLADGSYDMVLSYQDSLGNPVATSAVVSSIVIHTHTTPPTLLQPVASTAYNLVPIQYLLPGQAYPGSVKLIFADANFADTISMIDFTPRSTAYLNPTQFTANSPFMSATSNSLPDGVYSVQLSYQDNLGNPAATVAIDSIIIDTHTQTPVMMLPLSSTNTKDSLAISFILQETASSASIMFMGTQGDTITMLLNSAALTTGTNSFKVNVKDIINYTYISAITPNNVLPDEIYSVVLSYSDLLENPAASVTVDSVTVDTKTQAAMLTAPLNNAVVKSGYPVNLSFTLFEAATNGSVQVNFVSGNINCTTTLNAVASGSYSFTINPDNIGTSTGVTSTLCNSLPDGSYWVTVTYQDALGNPVATSNVGSFILDRVTDSPTIILPTAYSTSGATMNVSFNLPEAALNNIVNAELFGADTISMSFITSGSGVQNYTLNCTNLSATTGLTNASVSKIPNGIYTFVISYQDTLDNPAASAFAANVGIDIITQVPSLISPASASTVAEQMNVKFTIPQSPLNGSVKLLFNATGISDTLVLKNISLGTDSFTLDTKNLAASAFVQSSTMNSLSSGIYTVTLSYQDSSGDPAASASVTNVNLDNTTQPPVLIYPLDSSVTGQNMTVIFNLPEAPLSGSVDLIFNSAGFNDTLTLSNVTSGINSFILNTKNILSSLHVFSSRPAAAAISNGIYTITLSYRDYLGNTVASNSVYDERISNVTVAPSLSSPENNYVVSSNNPAFVLSFSIPETPSAGSVQAIFHSASDADTLSFNISAAGNYSFTLNPAMLDTSTSVAIFSNHALADGSYDVVIAYQNALGNPAASSNTGTITLDRVTLSPTIILPGSFSTNNSLVNVEFNLPENALSNTAILKLVGADTITISLQTAGNGLQRFTLNGNNLASTLGLINTTQSTIPNGVYNVFLIYQDALGNPAATAFETNVSVTGVTPPPSITTIAINPNCNMTADLSTAITSNTNNLILSYFSNSALTDSVSNQVNGPGTYYVKVTNAYGLSDSASIVVEATPAAPSAPVVSGTAICSGSTATLTASGTGTISWYDAATNGNWLGSGNNYTTAVLSGNATFYVQDSTCISSTNRTAANVTVNPFPVTTISLISGGISADQTGAIYQWLNCNSGYAPVAGQENRIVTAGEGNYAVMITLNGCTDTSECVNLITTAVNEIKNVKSVNIYPNPVSDVLVIENGENNTETVFQIFNSVGKFVVNGSFIEKTTVKTSDLSAGVYLIRLESGKSIQFKKFVKE